MVHVFGRRAFVAHGLLLAACASSPADSGPSNSLSETGRTRLEVSRIDDEIDPLARLATVPAGIVIEREQVPGGAERSFARAVLQPGESQPAAHARLRAFLASVPLPAGRRFATQTMFESDGVTSAPAGARSHVLANDAIVRTEDVVRTTLFPFEHPDEVAVGIRVQLSPEAAARFERATTAWLGRRMAIVVEEEVLTAPVVRAAIRGGEIQLTFEKDHSRADVERIARRLQPK